MEEKRGTGALKRAHRVEFLLQLAFQLEYSIYRQDKLLMNTSDGIG